VYQIFLSIWKYTNLFSVPIMIVNLEGKFLILSISSLTNLI